MEAVIGGGIGVGAGSDAGAERDVAVGPTPGPDTRDIGRGLTVVGGAGGTRAKTEDLRRAAAALDEARTRLEEAADRATDLVRVIDEASIWSPATEDTARELVRRIRGPRTGLVACATRSGEHASGLRRTASAYEDAERDTGALFRGGSIALGGLVGETGPLVAAAGGVLALVGALQAASTVAAARLLSRTPTPIGFGLRWVGQAGERSSGVLGVAGWALGGRGLLPRLDWPRAAATQAVVPGLAAFLRGLAPGRAPLVGDPVRDVSGRLLTLTGGLAWLLGRPPSTVVVAPVVAPARTTADMPPRGLGDLMDQVETGYPSSGRGADPGTVSIQRLEHEDGSVSWVVSIPGTEDWSPVAGANPLDLTSDLQAVAGRMSDAAEVVRQAMVSAGIQPEEAVALVGHSLGGLVAMQVAQDPVLQERFTIRTVLTAGSPVGALTGTLPAHTKVLSIESTADQVTAGDGAANRDDPQRTTVVVDPARTDWRGSASRAWQGEDPGAAHAVSAYTGAAYQLDCLDEPSIDAFRTAQDDVLGGVRAASTQVFQGLRVPAPASTTNLSGVSGPVLGGPSPSGPPG
ncbi:MAG TPA: hypothetical protein VGK35_13405 [Actinotalea sp.]